MRPIIRIPLLIVGAPLHVIVIGLAVALYVVGSLVEILGAAVEGRKPQLPPARHDDGTPVTWRELL